MGCQNKRLTQKNSTKTPETFPRPLNPRNAPGTNDIKQTVERRYQKPPRGSTDQVVVNGRPRWQAGGLVGKREK